MKNNLNVQYTQLVVLLRKLKAVDWSKEQILYRTIVTDRENTRILENVETIHSEFHYLRNVRLQGFRVPRNSPWGGQNSSFF